MALKLLLNIFRFQFLLILITARSEFSLINDIIYNEGTPAILNLKTCWTKVEKIIFISHSSVLTQFINSVNVTSDKENSNWFVLDLECADSMQFLREVL